MSSPPVAVWAGRLLGSSSRYRHPGDVIRLISGLVLLGCSLAASAAASRWLLGPAAFMIDGLGPASRVTTGLVQVACLAAAAVVVAATLRRRRFRLLAGLAVAAAVAAGVAAGIFLLFGGQHPDALTDNLARGSWLAGAAVPGPALIASAAAVVVAAAPWLRRPWRRAAWLTLLLVAAARLLTGTVLPMELILAIATGVTVGAAVLVAFGVPDRRMGPGEVAAALRRAGAPVESGPPGRGHGQGLEEVRGGRGGRAAAVRQGPGLGPARRRPAVPGVPGGAAAERRRHPSRRVAVPRGRASGPRRCHGRTGRRLSRPASTG